MLSRLLRLLLEWLRRLCLLRLWRTSGGSLVSVMKALWHGETCFLRRRGQNWQDEARKEGGAGRLRACEQVHASLWKKLEVVTVGENFVVLG